VTTYAEILKEYPEHLSWVDLEKIFNRDRRTLKRWRAQGRMAGIEFNRDPSGELVAIKATLVDFLDVKLAETLKDLTPPPMVGGSLRRLP
jgi:hypothetical protein